MAFDRTEYWKTIKQFKADLKVKEYEEIDKFLKEHNIKKIDFIRMSFQKLKEEFDKK